MAKTKSNLPKEVTSVTSFSKVFAAILFAILPILFLLVGIQYGLDLKF